MCPWSLRFAPLVSPPSEDAGYLSRGPRKGRRWTSLILRLALPRKVSTMVERRKHSPCVLRFVPLVSSPSGQTTKEYLSRGPRKGRHWVYILLPSPGTPIFGNGRRMCRLTNAFRRLLSTWPLAFRAVGFLAHASTYPRAHVKVARGLSSCALPQVEP